MCKIVISFKIYVIITICEVKQDYTKGNFLIIDFQKATGFKYVCENLMCSMIKLINRKMILHYRKR